MKILHVNAIDTLEAQSNTMPLQEAFIKVADTFFFSYRDKQTNVVAMNNNLKEFALSIKPNLLYMGKCELVEGDTIRTIKETLPTCKVIHYYGDFRLNTEAFVLNIGRQADLTLFCHKYGHIINEYKRLGIKDIRFFSAGVDAEVYRPLDVDKHYDIIFFGNNNNHLPGYKFRRESLIALAENGFTVLIHGSGWGDLFKPYVNVTIKGFVTNENYTKACCSAYMSLGVNAVDNIPMYTSWPRTLRCMACGIPHLCQKVPQIETYIPNTSVMYFDSIDSLVYSAFSVLDNKMLATKIGLAGRKEIEQNHTWDARVKQLLSMI